MARLRPAVIVHYYEISLKRGNRPLFLRQLARNLERAVSDLGPVRLRQLTGRILLDLAGNEHPEAVRARVARVCGGALVGRHRLTGRGLAHDEARLPRAVRALPQRALSARDVAGQGARSRRAPDRVAVPVAAHARPARRDPA